ncbi:MAG TPA: hypothetical protein DCQ04_00945 [Actinobacteria bacterium]|nr:hypothetical protein [Actinomycetota bacterium]
MRLWQPASSVARPARVSSPTASLSVMSVGHDGDDWVMQPVSGQAARKSYICPSCNQDIAAGTPHIVAWQEGWSSGVEDRRHWHTACWRRTHG